MRRKRPINRSMLIQNPAFKPYTLGAAMPPTASGNCWWTETGWYCCTSSNSSWPSCIPGGLTNQQRGYAPLPGIGFTGAAPSRNARVGRMR